MAAVGLAGCLGAPIASEPRGPTISAKGIWRAYGDLGGAKLAIDSDVNTAAISAASYANAKLTIDLGKPCLFNTIVVDHGPKDPLAFCRLVSVSISSDGRNYKQVLLAPGTRRITYLNLVTPALAQFIRLQAVVAGDRPWSVAEIYLE
jgi:hypothetical protein